MKGVAAVVFGGGLLFLGYLYVSGQLGGYGSGAPKVDTGAAKDAAGAAANAAGQASDSGMHWFLSTAWAPAALVALVLTGVMIKFWQKIGGFGRAVVLVLVAIAVTVFVLGVKH